MTPRLKSLGFEEHLTPEDIAGVLVCSLPTVWRIPPTELPYQGVTPSLRRYTVPDFKRWLDAHKVTSVAVRNRLALSAKDGRKAVNKVRRKS